MSGASSERVEREVFRLVASRFAIEEARLHRDLLLFDDLGADSLQLVELVSAIQDTFGIEVPSLQDRPLRTLGDVIGAIQERVS
jgi:acyl carrier protein